MADNIPEQPPFNEIEAVYEPRPEDWLARMVLNRIDDEGLVVSEAPLQSAEEKALQAAIAESAVKGTLLMLSVEQDKMTDGIFIEFTVHGHDGVDAMSNSLAPVFWGTVAVREQLGKFKVRNMQLAQVGELVETPGATLADLKYDVTEDARAELTVLTDVQQLVFSAA